MGFSDSDDGSENQSRRSFSLLMYNSLHKSNKSEKFQSDEGLRHKICLEKQRITITFSLVKQVKASPFKNIQIELNSDSIQQPKNHQQSKLRFLQSKIRNIQQNVEEISTKLKGMSRGLRRKYMLYLQRLLEHTINDKPKQLKEQSDIERDDVYQVFEIAQKNVAKNKCADFEPSRQSKSVQTQNIEHAQTQKQTGSFNWTRPQVLKYIAFIIVHQKFLSDQNYKFRFTKFSEYVTGGDMQKLKQKFDIYRNIYANKSLSQISQILIKKFSFSTEEIEEQKQKVLQYEAGHSKIQFPQTFSESELFEKLQDFTQHQFPKENVSIICSELRIELYCSVANYTFIRCSQKVKQKSKNWQYYNMIFEIELTISQVQITSVFDEEEEKKNLEKDSCKAKGYWISINQGRKAYFDRFQVIDQMRTMDLENKTNERQIMDSTWGEELAKQIDEQNKNKSSLKRQAKEEKFIIVKQEKTNWQYEEHLRFFSFLCKYEPSFLKLEQKLGGFGYFKIMSQYVKTKTFRQCYEHYWRLLHPYNTCKQFLEKESKALKFDRQSIQNQFRQQCLRWLRNDPMVVIEKRQRAREFLIDQNLADVSDEQVRKLLDKQIQKFKIKIILDNDSDRQVTVQNKSSQEPNKLVDKGSSQLEEKGPAKKPTNKLNRSKIYSLIPVALKCLQVKFLYQFMSEGQPEEKQYQNEAKVHIKIFSELKVKTNETKGRQNEVKIKFSQVILT